MGGKKEDSKQYSVSEFLVSFYKSNPLYNMTYHKKKLELFSSSPATLIDLLTVQTKNLIKKFCAAELMFSLFEFEYAYLISL